CAPAAWKSEPDHGGSYTDRAWSAPLRRDARAGPLAPRVGDEVDDEGNALQPVRLAESILEVVGPIACDEPAVVHLDGEPRRAPTHQRRVVEAKPPAVLGGRRPAGHQVGDEPVE